MLADPTAIPTDFELSIDGLEIGAQLFLSDLTLPAGNRRDVRRGFLRKQVQAVAYFATLTTCNKGWAPLDYKSRGAHPRLLHESSFKF